MRIPNCCSVTAAAAALFLGACSGSTGPSQKQQAQTLAQHLDSLYVTAVALATHDSRYNQESTNITYAEIAAYLGAVPRNVTVTMASGTATWKALEIERVSTALDTTYYLIAYPEADLHTSLLVTFDEAGNAATMVLVANDSIVIGAAHLSGTTDPAGVGGTCTLATGLTNTNLAVLANYSCLLATFSTTFSATFSATDGVDVAYTSLGVTSASIKGVRLQQMAPAGAPLAGLVHPVGEWKVGPRLARDVMR